MAINLQASFAACLAGLKVPPQIMYCIAQETGQPYVFYKDGMERGQGQGGQWGQGPPSQDLGYLSSQQQQSQQQLASQSQQQQQPPTPQPASVSPRQLCDDGPVQSALTSPVASPYPQSVPDVPATPMTPMTPMTPHPVGVADDDQVSGPLTPQHPPPSQSAAPQQGPSGPASHEQQELSPPHNPGQHNPDIERCYNPSATPGLDLQQQQQQQHHQYLSHHYSQRGHPVGPPPHVMSPTSFMHYLKQPGVLLTPLGPMGTEAVMAENFNSSMQDMRGMPDILQQQQQQQHQGKQGKHANSELRLFKCLTCGKDFKQKSTLLQHERIHTDSRPYGCTECGKRFRQQSHLTQHLRIHANEKPFACVYCERTFRQRAILNQHLRIHSDVSPHLVYKNGTLWPQDVPFPPDMESKEPSTENGGSPFDSEHSAQTPDHQRQANGCFSPESNVQYPAYFKDAKGMNHAVFGSGSNFALQYLKQGKGLPDVIQHGRSAGMPLYVRCPICQKEFKQKSTLLQHGCIHIESRPYPCPECGKRFRQQSHLTQHVRIHTNEKPYGCGYCGRNFRQRTILNQHLRIHTGEKPYKCGQCGKDFRQKAILDQHTRTHQGERPFCCPMPNCRRRFATDPEVKKHMDNHMNPHANKGRRPNNNSDAKHLLGRGVPPTAVVKPELYFPQCYVPAFGHPNNAFVNNGGQPQNGDFKPITTHPFAQNPSQSQSEHNGDFKNVQTGAAPVTIVPAHQFPASNSGNPVQAHTNGANEFPKPTPVQ